MLKTYINNKVDHRIDLSFVMMWENTMSNSMFICMVKKTAAAARTS